MIRKTKNMLYSDNSTFWAVLGTITVGIGSGFMGNLIYGIKTDGDITILFWIGAFLMVLSGILFYYNYSLLDHIVYKSKALLKEKNAEFLWDCHNPANSDDTLYVKYENERYNVTKKLLRSCRDTIVMPGPVSAMFIDEIKIKFKEMRKKLNNNIVFAFFLLGAAVFLIGYQIFETVRC